MRSINLTLNSSRFFSETFQNKNTSLGSSLSGCKHGEVIKNQQLIRRLVFLQFLLLLLLGLCRLLQKHLEVQNDFTETLKTDSVETNVPGCSSPLQAPPPQVSLSSLFSSSSSLSSAPLQMAYRALWPHLRSPLVSSAGERSKPGLI